MKPTLTTLIFDLDGTLLDTLQDLMDSVNYALHTYQMPKRNLQEVRAFVGNGVKKLMEQAVPTGTDETLFADVFSCFKAHYVDNCKNKTTLYQGISELLSTLSERGYKLAIVSNKLQKGVDELYETYFKETVQIAIGETPELPVKPAPHMVQKALQFLNSTTQETIYIGDSEVDIATANNSGLPSISVLWGFRDRFFLTQHGATHFAENTHELLEIIETWDEQRAQKTRQQENENVCR